jgi:ABC-type Fe3+-hydroxamate transport system substrate-binding protein
LIKLKPDIVFLTYSQKKISESIKKIKNIKIYSVKVKRLKDINREIIKIAKILKIDYKEIPIAMLVSVSKIRKKLKKVLIVIDRDRNNINNVFAVGSDNFINDYLSILGLKNSINSKNYPKINLETIFKINPEIIIDLTYGADISVWKKYKNIKAIKNKKIYKANINLTVPSPFIYEKIIELKNKLKSD